MMILLNSFIRNSASNCKTVVIAKQYYFEEDIKKDEVWMYII